MSKVCTSVFNFYLPFKISLCNEGPTGYSMVYSNELNSSVYQVQLLYTFFLRKIDGYHLYQKNSDIYKHA